MSTCHQATRSSGFLRRSGARSSSPFTYGDIKNGTLAEVHDIGELWAATLWDVRNGVNGAGGVGAAVIEQLVVSGMKLTPCNPTMLQARRDPPGRRQRVQQRPPLRDLGGVCPPPDGHRRVVPRRRTGTINSFALHITSSN